MDWIDAAQNRVRWHSALNSVMSFQIPLNLENLTSWRTISFSRSLCFLELVFMEHMSTVMCLSVT